MLCDEQLLEMNTRIEKQLIEVNIQLERFYVLATIYLISKNWKHQGSNWIIDKGLETEKICERIGTALEVQKLREAVNAQKHS